MPLGIDGHRDISAPTPTTVHLLLMPGYPIVPSVVKCQTGIVDDMWETSSIEDERSIHCRLVHRLNDLPSGPIVPGIPESLHMPIAVADVWQTCCVQNQVDADRGRVWHSGGNYPTITVAPSILEVSVSVIGDVGLTDRVERQRCIHAGLPLAVHRFFMPHRAIVVGIPEILMGRVKVADMRLAACIQAERRVSSHPIVRIHRLDLPSKQTLETPGGYRGSAKEAGNIFRFAPAHLPKAGQFRIRPLALHRRRPGGRQKYQNQQERYPCLPSMAIVLLLTHGFPPPRTPDCPAVPSSF